MSLAHVFPNELKFQGDVKQQSQTNGEHLARSSLTAEFLLLDTCEYPINTQSKHTGTAQYPEIILEPSANIKKITHINVNMGCLGMRFEDNQMPYSTMENRSVGLCLVGHFSPSELLAMYPGASC